MASGTIISRVRTSDADLPIQNATVAYYEDAPGGVKRLVGLRKTDLSGMTQPIELRTPNASASQSPDASGDPEPYRTVDIAADHPDYNRVTVRGVQVFDGILTTQDITLVPSPGAGEAAFPDTVYDTGDQGL